MPKIRTREQIEEDFTNRSNWKRSRKGNLWRNWKGLNLTIFTRDDDFYGWVYADSDGPHFSQEGYETVQDAMEVLMEELL